MSQIPTLAYYITKNFNNILQPYIQSNYSIKSITDFIQISKSTPPHKCIPGSLDAEKLFINVYIQETIKIIIENLYNQPSIPPPAIKPNILENFSKPSRQKFLSTTLQEKYTHKLIVLLWVLHLNPLYPNFTYPTLKTKYLTQ